MDHDELMAMATETICELNTLTDAQAQELQGARAEIKRLRGALGWYVGRSAESLMFDGGRRAAEALSEATE